MNNKLTNLLPPERLRTLRRDYFIRFGATGAIMLTVLTGVAAILLMPSYVFLAKSEKVKKNYLVNIEATFSSIDEKKLSKRLLTLSNDVATIIAMETVPSVSSVIRNILATPHPGIIISNFSYTSSTGGRPGTLVVSGTSATRDSLRKYQVALQNSALATFADLPVSAYAKDSQISFSITITLSP